ncbi:MAG: recombination mediator RecR [Schleiferiaceae bacterium]|jgi:recombination protein RecR
MELPSAALERAVSELARLPGIGRRSALRLALHLIQQGDDRMLQLAEAIHQLAEQTTLCRLCHSLSDTEVCGICADGRRDPETLCVVEDVRDVLALENTQAYRGRYHVLGGLISPMDGMGPADLTVDQLVQRVADDGITEVILALSTTMEGDTTSFYLYRRLQSSGVRLTVMARGLPVGDALEYADERTLSRAVEQRVPYEQTIKG